MQKILTHAPTAARLLLGLVFFVFGLNGFLGFIPQPELSGGAADFMGALAATGYLFPLIKGTEVVVGLMLLSNRFVPLALTLIAPVIVNIALFHLVLAPVNLGMVAFLLAAELYLAWSYRDAFRAMLRPKTEPARPGRRDAAREHREPAHA
ncbi:MAG TPA: DoxX family protein [Sandaracinaceae bacterium LLY-WYZ-13_1]|nr:DoxX family protein [Sandaracinaceae bacterium LLY-WYZ-13_1]